MLYPLSLLFVHPLHERLTAKRIYLSLLEKLQLKDDCTSTIHTVAMVVLASLGESK
jgi:hypothetical protein